MQVYTSLVYTYLPTVHFSLDKQNCFSGSCEIRSIRFKEIDMDTGGYYIT